MSEPEPALIPDDIPHAQAMLRGLLALGSEDWADLVQADRELVEQVTDKAYVAIHGQLP